MNPSERDARGQTGRVTGRRLSGVSPWGGGAVPASQSTLESWSFGLFFLYAQSALWPFVKVSVNNDKNNSLTPSLKQCDFLPKRTKKQKSFLKADSRIRNLSVLFSDWSPPSLLPLRTRPAQPAALPLSSLSLPFHPTAFITTHARQPHHIVNMACMSLSMKCAVAASECPGGDDRASLSRTRERNIANDTP